MPRLTLIACGDRAIYTRQESCLGVDDGGGLTTFSARRRLGLAGLALGWMGWLTYGASAQAATSGSGLLTVRGRVVNALNGSPIPRALVSLNSRAVLSDALGRFEFAQFSVPAGNSGGYGFSGAASFSGGISALAGASSGVQAWVQVRKPGYTQTLDGNDGMSQQPITDLSSTLELKLYPDALIDGVVTGSDRRPLNRVQISLYREMGDETERRMQQGAFAMTDSHGEFRFEQPPGRYRVAIRYSPRANDEAEAVLPQTYPPHSERKGFDSFQVAAGEEKRIDLQARTGSAYPVTFRSETDTDRPSNIRITVQPSAGGSFSVFAQPTRNPGEYRIELPSGSYELHGIQQNREKRLEGQSRVTVAGRGVSGLVLHLAEVSSIPVQVAFDPTSANTVGSVGVNVQPTQNQNISPLNLNVRLQKLGEQEDDGNSDIRVTALPDNTFALQAGVGTYHLAAQRMGSWYVESASYGTANLLTQNLVVAPGAGGEPIRVVLSNASGQVSGKVRVNGAGAMGFVYLLAHEPSLTPVTVVRTGTDGSYSSRLPPGSYTALALDHRFVGDLRDPEVVSRLPGGAGTVDVTAGGKTSLDLNLQTMESVP